MVVGDDERSEMIQHLHRSHGAIGDSSSVRSLEDTVVLYNTGVLYANKNGNMATVNARGDYVWMKFRHTDVFSSDKTSRMETFTIEEMQSMQSEHLDSFPGQTERDAMVEEFVSEYRKELSGLETRGYICSSYQPNDSCKTSDQCNRQYDKYADAYCGCVGAG